jgi:hypothetical protein
MPGPFICPNDKPFTYGDSQKVDSESRTADNRQLSIPRLHQFRPPGGLVVVASSARSAPRSRTPYLFAS